MLELPESRTVARQMNEALKGKRVKNVVLEQTPHRFAFYSEQKERYAARLTGQTIEGACQHGGMVELDFAEDMLYFSDGAYPRYFAVGKAPKKQQLLLEFEEGDGFSVSVQMYGCMRLERRDVCAHAYYRSALEKPDPLEDGFSYEYFRSLYPKADAKMSVKTFLATEQRIPGIGNGVLQDILWNAGLDPRCDMRSVTDAEFHALYDALRKTLRTMCAAGGRNTERGFFGERGGYACVLSRETLGTPCPKCGGTIEKAAYMGGTVYFCPGCERR